MKIFILCDDLLYLAFRQVRIASGFVESENRELRQANESRVRKPHI